MSKERRTRRQKEITQLRHQLEQRNQLQNTFTSPAAFTSMPITQPKSVNVITVSHYPYLGKELRKTATLSLGIITVEIIIFSLLKYHVIVLPNLVY